MTTDYSVTLPNGTTINYDPSLPNEVAKLQGTMVGMEAANADSIGVFAAPTSALNQGGWYVTADENGQPKLFKNPNASLFSWYDQPLNTEFDFRPSANTAQAQPAQGSQAAGTASAAAEEDNDETQTREVTQEQIDSLINMGYFDNKIDAAAQLISEGYTITDAVKFTDEEEAKIQQVMNILGLTRDEAIIQLTNKELVESPTGRYFENLLTEELQDVKDKQGWFGDFWNGVKNATGLGLSTKDIEEAMEDMKSVEDVQKIRDMIAEYDKKQQTTKTIAGVGIAAISAAAGPFGLIGSAILGAGVNTAFQTSERITDEVKGNAADHLGWDVVHGAVAGLVGGRIGTLGAGGPKTGAVRRFLQGIPSATASRAANAASTIRTNAGNLLRRLRPTTPPTP